MPWVLLNEQKLQQNTISRLTTLPETVTDDTPDIIAIGSGVDTQFYFKNTVSTPVVGDLTLSQNTLYFDGDIWSDTPESIATITASGGNGEYSWSVSGDSGITINPNGNSCEITVNYSEGSYSATVTCESGEQSETCEVSVNFWTCLTGDTLITLWGGKKKRIDEIEVGDKLLAFNTDTGLLSPDPVLYCDSHQNKTHSHYDKYEFNDGTVIKVVHRHRFYNVEEQRMIHLDVFFIGDRVYKEDGTMPKLISAVNHAEEGEIRHYTIFSKYNNYFANGILSGNSRTKEITIKEDT